MLLLTLLGSVAIAGPITIRSNSVQGVEPVIIKGVLDNLNGGILKTDKDTIAWKGDRASVELIFQDAKYLLSDIRSGTVTVAGSPHVTIWDKPDWLNPARNLDKNLDGLVNTLVSKKIRFDAIGRSQDILTLVQQIKPAVDVLVKNIFSKLPNAAQLVARPISNQITGKVDRALKAFQVPASPRPLGGSNPTASPWWAAKGSAAPNGLAPPTAAAPKSPPPPPSSQAPAWSNPQPPAQPPAQNPVWSNSQPPAQPQAPAWSNPQPPFQAPAWSNSQPPNAAAPPTSQPPVWSQQQPPTWSNAQPPAPPKPPASARGQQQKSGWGAPPKGQ